MSPRSPLARNLGAAAALALMLAGCVVAPAPRYRADALITVAPPPPRREVYGPAPGPGMIWLGGYWNWADGRHVWVDGHWEARRAGYRWAPGHWVRARGGWYFVEGRWVR